MSNSNIFEIIIINRETMWYEIWKSNKITYVRINLTYYLCCKKYTD